MFGANLFRTFKGLSELKLYNITESILYNLPVPLDISIDNGIQERRIPSRNVYGEQIFTESFISARDPVLRIVFPVITPEILELKTQRKFANNTAGLKYTVTKTVDITQFEYIQAVPLAGIYIVPLNKLFNKPSTLASSFVSNIIVSRTDNNLSEHFTITSTATDANYPAASQTNTNTYLPTTKNIYYYGTLGSDEQLINNALIFRASDVSSDNIVTISVDFTETNLLNLNSLFNDSFKVFATMVTTENQLVVLTAPKVKPSFQGSSFSPSMEQVECIFYMSTPVGQCKPYDIIYTDPTFNPQELEPEPSPVLLYLKGDDFIDSSPFPKVVTTSAASAIATDIKKYGTGSFNFNNDYSFISIPSGLGLLYNTTVEFWIYVTGSPWGDTSRTLLSFASNLSTEPTIANSIRYLSNNWIYTAVGSSNILNMPNSTWTHVAMTFTPQAASPITVATLFVNGGLVGSFTGNTTNSVPSGDNLHLGNGRAEASVRWRGAYCYIDSFRITQGIRYTTNFNRETDTGLAY